MTVSSRRVEKVLDATNSERRGALIGYLPIGFPTVSASIEAAITMAENGVDIIELGLPYSDPVMDGPVIQAATQVALSGGFRVAHAFDAVEAITATVSTPVILMTYWNPVVQYGVDRFADDLLAAGGAGVITPDLIPDSAGEWLKAAERTGLDHIFLAAPSSSDARLDLIVQKSRGFVYAVSTMGVTGARTEVDDAARTLVTRLRSAGVSRTCVGLGISTAEQVRDVLDYADGAIVGSALVKALADGGVSQLAQTASILASGTRLN